MPDRRLADRGAVERANRLARFDDERVIEASSVNGPTVHFRPDEEEDPECTRT